jgi:hypothetical protein
MPHGPKADMTARYSDVHCQRDCVAKVFLGWRTKFLRTTDAFRARRREGSHRLSQKRLRTFVRAVRSLAALESPKIDFREIFGVNRFSTFATQSEVKRTSG